MAAMDQRPAYLRRRTSSAVDHRKPKWAINDKSYQIWMANPRRTSSNYARATIDYSMDNFAFDASHLEQWQMPEGLGERLPKNLFNITEDWQKAGAALCTTLDRTHEFYKNAMYYAYPDKSNNLLSRRVSANEQAVVGATKTPTPSATPMISMPTPVLPATIASLEKLALTQSLQEQVPAGKQVIGMETPPFSPVDGGSCATPVHCDDKTQSNNVLPDLARLHSELSPSHSPLEALTPDSSSPGFDDNSWEFYLGKFEQEMRDSKECICRLKGYGKRIEIILMELAPELKPEIKLAVMDFTKWWESLKPKVSKCEERVKSLDVPKLEYVNIEWDVERARQMGKPHERVLESE